MRYHGESQSEGSTTPPTGESSVYVVMRPLDLLGVVAGDSGDMVEDGKVLNRLCSRVNHLSDLTALQRGVVRARENVRACA